MNLSLEEIRRFGNIEFLAKQLVEGFITGMHKSPYHGFSVEFAEHRLYNTGESTRHIDWKVFGKTDKLFVKRYEEETNLRCMILLDVSSSMYYPLPNYDKLTFSAMAAASLTHMLQKQRDAVGLCTFSDHIELQTPIKSTPSHAHTLFLSLEQLLQSKHEKKETLVSPVIHEIAEKMNKRSLIIIFSDMFDRSSNKEELFTALQHLKHNKHEVLLFHVKDGKTEVDFNFEERPYEFIDLESGEKIKLQPSQIKETYIKSVADETHELKLKCGQYKIEFIEADVNQGFDQILLAYLIKRSKMV